MKTFPESEGLNSSLACAGQIINSVHAQLSEWIERDMFV